MESKQTKKISPIKLSMTEADIAGEARLYDNDQGELPGIIPDLSTDWIDSELYAVHDLRWLQNLRASSNNSITSLQTLDDLLAKDDQREKDGFPRRIRIGKVLKPSKNKENNIVVVPTTSEPKFLHDDSISEDSDNEAGAGDGDVGDVIGEKDESKPEGEGDGSGAGQGQEASHDQSSDMFTLGKILTEKFALPNLKPKGKKRSFSKYIYDLTDRNRETGQILDKVETLRRVVMTNIMLGNIDPSEEIDPSELLINPKDRMFRILSREKDFESQAVVFFVRDYSGSMQGKPTEVVVTQHLFLYSWLMYQYKNRVDTRFILHDNTAKEVPDFYTYYNLNVAGGTNVYPAYQLVNQIVQDEQLERDNNIYIFHGTDGDDWETSGEKAIAEINVMLKYVNRFAITVARNSWAGNLKSAVETYIEKSELLIRNSDLMRLDSMVAENTDESRIIKSIKKLIQEEK